MQEASTAQPDTRSPDSPICHVFFPDGHLGVAPTVIGLTRALAEDGFEVVVYIVKTPYAEPGGLHSNVRVISLPARGPWLEAFANLTTPFVWRVRRLANVLEIILFAARALRHRVTTRAGPHTSAVAVGVNLDGAIVALVNRWVCREPFVFLSLEMSRKPADYRWIAAPWRWLARCSLRIARALIIQGSDRLEVLSQQYGWQHPRVIFLPNSAEPRTGPEPSLVNYFRSMFSLHPSTPLALQAGMIADTTYSLSLAQVFSGIDDWALVLHERRARTSDDPYIQTLRSANSRNLYLSLKPVPFDKVREIYEAATVGLAFYSPDAAGAEGLTISSSGKFALYLRYAVPVLVSGVPALADTVAQFRCGVAIRDPSDRKEIRAALDTVMATYDEYRRNARRCYDTLFNFDERVKPLVQFLREADVRAVDPRTGRAC